MTSQASSSSSSLLAGAAAVADMTAAARRIFEALQQGAAHDETDDAFAARAQALHSEYEQRWQRVRELVELLEKAPAGRPPDAAASSSEEISHLRQQRRELRATLAERNHELKEQIDMLRQTLCDCQFMGA